MLIDLATIKTILESDSSYGSNLIKPDIKFADLLKGSISQDPQKLETNQAGRLIDMLGEIQVDKKTINLLELMKSSEDSEMEEGVEKDEDSLTLGHLISLGIELPSLIPNRIFESLSSTTSSITLDSGHQAFENIWYHKFDSPSLANQEIEIGEKINLQQVNHDLKPGFSAELNQMSVEGNVEQAYSTDLAKETNFHAGLRSKDLTETDLQEANLNLHELGQAVRLKPGQPIRLKPEQPAMINSSLNRQGFLNPRLDHEISSDGTSLQPVISSSELPNSIIDESSQTVIDLGLLDPEPMDSYVQLQDENIKLKPFIQVLEGDDTDEQRPSLDKDKTELELKSHQITSRLKDQVFFLSPKKSLAKNLDYQQEKTDQFEFESNIANLENQFEFSASFKEQIQVTPSESTSNDRFEQNIFKQVIDKMQYRSTEGHHEVKIQLKPDHLGQVNIKMAIEQGVVTAEFIIENQAVKEILAAQLPELRQAMQELGMQLGQVDVGFSNNGSHSKDSFKERAQLFKPKTNRQITNNIQPFFDKNDTISQVNLRV